MDIDTTQPWGIALDYFGRATITESGHTVRIRVYDQTMGEPLAPDPLTGTYPQVYVSAQVTETGANFSQLRGYGEVVVRGEGAAPIVPDQSAVANAVAAALSDFAAGTAAYAELCATWGTPADGGTTGTDPGDGGGSDSGSGSGTDPDPGEGDGSGDPDSEAGSGPDSDSGADPGDPEAGTAGDPQTGTETSTAVGTDESLPTA
ncbi:MULTISPECIES: hypothetical protein [unclassified Streptomyces]|uniref:hypothetical protein n=1 Tax=unclassified Streptomyces TaxID=2593676 RepID=UPI002E284EBE|nr:hypothetical protein [Streptomyces sp. NBC_00223]